MYVECHQCVPHKKHMYVQYVYINIIGLLFYSKQCKKWYYCMNVMAWSSNGTSVEVQIVFIVLHFSATATDLRPFHLSGKFYGLLSGSGKYPKTTVLGILVLRKPHQIHAKLSI